MLLPVAQHRYRESKQLKIFQDTSLLEKGKYWETIISSREIPQCSRTSSKREDNLTIFQVIRFETLFSYYLIFTELS